MKREHSTKRVWTLLCCLGIAACSCDARGQATVVSYRATPTPGAIVQTNMSAEVVGYEPEIQFDSADDDYLATSAGAAQTAHDGGFAHAQGLVTSLCTPVPIDSPTYAPMGHGAISLASVATCATEETPTTGSTASAFAASPTWWRLCVPETDPPPGGQTNIIVREFLYIALNGGASDEDFYPGGNYSVSVGNSFVTARSEIAAQGWIIEGELEDDDAQTNDTELIPFTIVPGGLFNELYVGNERLTCGAFVYIETIANLVTGSVCNPVPPEAHDNIQTLYVGVTTGWYHAIELP